MHSLMLNKLAEEEFKKLVSLPIREEDLRAFKQFNCENEQNASNCDAEDGENNSNEENEEDGNVDLKLEKDDYEAVQRLKSLGFNEVNACQAYFAFDKNENLAANYLYESRMMDEEDETILECI